MRLALFGASLAWFAASQSIAGSASRGLARRFALADEQTLITTILMLFLLTVGFSVLQSISGQRGTLRDVLGLPKRATAAAEWATGAAIGWGILLLAVLPMAIAGTLRPGFWTEPRAFWLLAINLLTLAVAALVEEVAFRGYPYRRLIEVIGPTKATISLAILFGLLHALNPQATWSSVLITMLAGILLSLGWLRTHALWLSWGLHFAWNASMGIVFGLPVSGIDRFASVVQTRAIGRHWLTGGVYGPEGAPFTAIAILIGIALLVRLTRDYAWDYTRAPIIAAGYPVDVAPPAAHTAMEASEQQAQTTRPPTLVQILPVTSQTRSIAPPPPIPTNPDTFSNE